MFRFNCRDLFRFTDGVFCSAEKAKLEKTHATALKREQDEVTSLRTQLAEINDAHKIEMEHAISEIKTHRACCPALS